MADRKVVRFGPFELDPRAGELRKQGIRIKLREQPVRILAMLLDHPGEVLLREEIRTTLWPNNTMVDFDHGINAAVQKLRDALGDSASEPRYVETVARRGYRFIGEVEKPAEEAPQAVPIGPKPLWRPGFAIPALLVLLAVSLGGWWVRRDFRAHWARNQAPEIERFLYVGDFEKAAALAKEARAILPSDPILEKLWLQSTGDMSVTSEPVEVSISIRPYGGDPNVWQELGKTPIKNARMPMGTYVWRATKPGFAPIFYIARARGFPEPGYLNPPDLTFRLRPLGSVPPDMAAVSGSRQGLEYPTQTARWVSVDAFLIDRHEVTNEQYKKFVDAGGYQKRDFWKQPFVEDGRTIPWEEAVARFRDATGRPGPATWEVGTYGKGMERHPVAGVSWYEAAAYAEFAGKSLPTAYHWSLASQANSFTGLIAPGSNFQGEGTQPVGSSSALSGFGTTDMAGNVKEWCLNEGTGGKRFILGGGFGEPGYMFHHTDQQSPWDRRPNFGFRCVKLDAPASAMAAARIEVSSRDFSKDKPVSNEVFEAYKELYAYDKGELDARVEEKETQERWTREKISFNAAYGHERVIVHLFVPRHGSAPFQTVVYFPGAGAAMTGKLDLAAAELSDKIDFLLKTGRALLFPIYRGHYERWDGFKPGANPPAKFRDYVIAWSKDLGRSLDYLETRKDMDATRVAYFGASLGGVEGPILAAVDSRIKTMILSSGGYQNRYDLPEVDPFNFSPHVTIPVLMLNGRYDQTFPLESSQIPLFHNLGTPAKDKKHVVWEGGHGALPRPEFYRECLDWLDRYLGPVPR